jgi:single-stranded-DNA-specific exonuclease
MQKRWRIKDTPETQSRDLLMKELNVSEIVANMLVNRGIVDRSAADRFFHPNLDQLHDPFLMASMDVALARLVNAIEHQEKIMIYGDYDVDGTTAVSLFYSVLKSFTSNCDYYIPDRYLEGYGVSEKGVRFAAESGCSLMVTLDCGVKAIDQAKLANSLGLDLVICDHHTPGDELPEAIVLDPKRTDCSYPFKELCGCGVGFKLLQALFIHYGKPMEELYQQLDLLAISIGADIVSVTGENRTLAYWGLRMLNARPRPGVKVMVELAQRSFPLTLTDVVFTIAPRINAAGRMGDAKTAIALLTAETEHEAKPIAQAIQAANDERKHIDEEIKHEAIELLTEHALHHPNTNVVYKSGWHKGVIGIVASRLIEQRYRPTIVFTQTTENGLLTGSVRSIPGINVHDVLENCSAYIEQFGGHYFAAGLSITEDNLVPFTEAFEADVAARMTPEMLVPQQEIEAEIDFQQLFLSNESLYEVPRLKKILDSFEPHGPDNMKPVFVTRNVYVSQVKLLKGQHLKATFFQPTHANCKLDAIGFFMPDAYDVCSNQQPLELAYTLESNTWNGKSKLQLNIKDIRSMNWS